MTTIIDVVEGWKERIQHDLASFVDPGTQLQLEVDGRAIQALWIMRNEPREAVFQVSSESGATVRFRAQELAYKSFIASPEMADLVGLAKMILQASPTSVFVETPAEVEESESSVRRGPATALLEESLDHAQKLTATAIVIVTGDAGAGKTSVLQELVRQSAAKYVSGETSRILLYVNAQGRALARLEEALATELSDLRARLTYHSVPALTRLGLIVPVIDGFDELLGVSGYDEAFSSLSRFVEDLNGEGQIIASARSTYYEQEFVSRANSVSALGAQIWHQIPLRVLEWGSEQVEEYFSKRLAADGLTELGAELRAAFDEAFAGENAKLKTKPFFVSRVLRLVFDGITFASPGGLLETLVQAYADREVDKLKGKSGEPLLDRAQIIQLLGEIAEEMWNQESRELDRRSTKDVAEFTLATHGIPELIQRYVIERMPAMAFLTSGSRPGNVTFEHESFFAYFLGHRLAVGLRSEPIRLHAVLGRSAMPEDVASIAAEACVEGCDSNALRGVLEVLSKAAALESNRNLQVRENAGLLVAAILRSWAAVDSFIEGGTIANLIIPGSSLAGIVVSNFSLVDVEIRRVDLRGTQFIESSFERGLLHDVVIDVSTTRLEFADFDPTSQLLGLRISRPEGTESVFDPVRIRDSLAQVGMTHLESGASVLVYSVDPGVIEVIQRIVRGYQRSNPISVNEEEPKMSAIWRLRDWPRIEQLLVESGVVRREYKATSGVKKTFLRRQVLADEILVGLDPAAAVSPPVRALWESLAKEFPEGLTAVR